MDSATSNVGDFLRTWMWLKFAFSLHITCKPIKRSTVNSLPLPERSSKHNKRAAFLATRPMTSCHHCSSLNAKNYKTFEGLSQENNYELFHKNCTECDKAKPPLPIRLCEKCDHLRLWHLLSCFPSTDLCTDDEIYVKIDPFRGKSSGCDFCSYLASCFELHFEYMRVDHEVAKDADNFVLSFPTKSHRGFVLGPMGIWLHPFFNGTPLISKPRLKHEQSLPSRNFVDWSILDEWVSTQSERHMSPKSALSFLSEKLQDVRVIDVEQLSILHMPPGCEYVALSYVWGDEPGEQFQTTRMNSLSLELSGALEHVILPKTITDAILVCQKLGQKYLWVDRLCIVQDETTQIKSVQLNQMGAIYRQATFTIVALAGNGAAYGLPGVSQPRKSASKTLRLDNFELIGSTPNLYACTNRSVWQTRGWTFQESAASMSLLYFTEFGAYFRSYGNDMSLVMAEGLSKPDFTFADGSDDFHYVRLVELYTRRTLRFPVDILRAFAGVLHGIYGQLTVFGMPWRALDRALMWKEGDSTSDRRSSTDAEIFPSWSWASATGPIDFIETGSRGCSVAFWGMVNGDDKSSPQVSIATPRLEDDLQFHSDKQALSTHMAAALAWTSGCLRTRAPEYLQREYLSRTPRDLWKTWPDYTTYWHAAFDPYQTLDVFQELDVALASKQGRIMVHSQTSQFTLDWLGERSSQPGWQHFLLRAKDGRVAGIIDLGEHLAKEYKTVTDELFEVEFLALSTCRSPEKVFAPTFADPHFVHIPLSTFYGCPCSHPSRNLNEAPVLHISPCPHHPEFSVPVPFQPWPIQLGLRTRNPNDRVRAYAKHLSEISYLDNQGELLHHWDEVPGLCVLLIRARETMQGKIYQRLGIGRVSLKRWVESEPVFKTVVME